MKKNNFKVKKIDKNKIVLEEEGKRKSPFLLFFGRYGLIIYLGLLTISISTFMVSMLFSLSNLGVSGNYEDAGVSLSLEFSDPDGTGVAGSTGNLSEINISNMLPITDEYASNVFNKKYGNTIKKDSIVVLTNIVTFGTGSNIYYYSDGTCLVNDNNNWYKVNALANGGYGVELNGNIVNYLTKKINIINSGSETLTDGTTIKYFSDSSAIVTKDGLTILVRNIDNINKTGLDINYILPSIVSIINNGNVSNLSIVKTITTGNGFVINYYNDGSAIINLNNKYLKVRKSKDIIISNNNFIEIANNSSIDLAYKRTVGTTDIYYYNDGSGITKFSDSDYRYVTESSNINIGDSVSISGGYSDTRKVNTLPDNSVVIYFNNDLVLIIKTDNTMSIVEDDNLLFDSLGNIKNIGDTVDESKEMGYISFTINNNIEQKIKYRLVLEESVNEIPATNLKYQMVIGNNKVDTNILNHSSNVWNAGSTLAGGTTLQRKSYILYEGTMENSESMNVSLGLWIDYETITNQYQNKSFVGTIRLYAWATEE